MSFSTPLSIAGRWNYGPFWERILENPHYDLPQWSRARDHIGSLFYFLQPRLLLEVRKYIDVNCPFFPIHPLQENGEYFHENERRSHFLTVGYFRAVCSTIMLEMQVSTDQNALRVLNFEIARLRSLLAAIAAIVGHEPSLPTQALESQPRKAVQLPNTKILLEYRGRGHSTMREESVAVSESDSGLSDSHSENDLKSLPSQTNYGSESAVTSDEEDFDSYEKEIRHIVLSDSVKTEDSFAVPKFPFTLPPLSSTCFHWQISNAKYAEDFPW